jgi:hypothetical protein
MASEFGAWALQSTRPPPPFVLLDSMSLERMIELPPGSAVALVYVADLSLLEPEFG